MVICCPREGRGGRNAQVPQEGDPPGPQQLGCFPSTPHPARVRVCLWGRTSPSPTACLMATPGGCFPAQLTSTAASAPRGAQLPEAGRAGDNAGDGSRDRHRHLPMAAPKAQPSIRRSLAQPSRPCRHAQQESRYEPGWASLCRCPNISSEGCVLKVHHSVMLTSTTW